MRIRLLAPGWLRASATALLLWSCSGGGSTGPEGPDPTVVAQVSVTPSTGTVDVGESLQFQALVTNAQGAALSDPVSWSSSPTSVATVNPSGLVTGRAQGTATITASAGGRSGSASITVNDPRPPAAPSNVVATAVSDTEIEVTWDDNSDNETGFTIERQTVAAAPSAAAAAAQFGVAGTVPSNTELFLDNSAVPNTNYEYRVFASNGNGESGATTSATTVTSHELEITVVAGPVTVTTTSLPTGQVGTAYGTTLAATGGDGVGYEWSLTVGALPDGLTLTASTSVISGTPTAAGTSNFTVQATSGGESGTMELSITISALPPVVVTNTSLAGGTVGSPFSQTLTATGGDGTYTWEVTIGTLPDGLLLTSNTGLISGTPTAAGTSIFTVEATSAGLMGSKELSITIFAGGGGGPGFDIELVYLSAVSATHMAAFESARSSYESIITSDLADNFGGLPACGDFHPATAGDVDDLIIYVKVGPIDGPFGTLGQAGPCYTRGTGGLPMTGAMNFDEADLDNLHGDGLLLPTILHEMGHVLGIGTLWDDMGLLTGPCTDPHFTGAGAVTSFNAAGGVGPTVPVEDTGAENDGSNCTHWRESVLVTELMTPTLNGGFTNPLSAISISSLGDQGYSVNTSLADPYTVPTEPPPGAPPAEQGVLIPIGNDILPSPIFRVYPDGRIEMVRAGGSR